LQSSLIASLYNFSFVEIIGIMDSYSTSFKKPSQCGLSPYDIHICPFFDLSNIINERKTKAGYNSSVVYPSVSPLFNESYQMSFLNLEYGLPKWIALCYYKGYLNLGKNTTFNQSCCSRLESSRDCACYVVKPLISCTCFFSGFDGGFSTMYGTQLLDLYDNITTDLSVLSFQNTDVNPFSDYAMTGSRIIVDSAVQYIANSYINAFSSATKVLVYDEFNNYNGTVPCDPSGETSVFCYNSSFYTFGYCCRCDVDGDGHGCNDIHLIYQLLSYHVGNVSNENLLIDHSF